jgi:hypothetical protein
MKTVHWLVTINRAKLRSLKVDSRVRRPLDRRCHNPMHIAGRFPGAGGRPLRRRRANAVNLRPASAARDRKPSKPPPIIVATTAWAIAGRFPGRPLRRRRGMRWDLTGRARKVGLAPH